MTFPVRMARSFCPANPSFRDSKFQPKSQKPFRDALILRNQSDREVAAALRTNEGSVQAEIERLAERCGPAGRQGSTQLALRSGMELMACRLADQNARRIPPGPANRAASAPDFDAFRMFLESGETHQELPWKTQWHCLNLRTRLGTKPSAALFQIRLRPCLWRFVRRSAKTDGL